MENTSALAGLIFFLAFAGMILLHELGHFLAARLFGIEVEEFGFGLPPKMLTLFHWKETEFTLNWLPIGGFVRPKGENDPNVPGGLAAANPWKRLGVLFAGPIMNLLAGVILISVLFMQIGIPDYGVVTVTDVVPNSPAEQAGFNVGDVILSVEGSEVHNITLLQQTIRNNLDKSLVFKFQRGEEIVTIIATPSSERTQREGALGFSMAPLTVMPSSWLETVGPAFRQAYEEIDFLLSIPGMIIDKVITAEQARPVGLKGIFDLVNESLRRDVASRNPSSANSAEQPTFWTLQLVISLTISIGLINLFPFPALDGGRIIFVLPELVTRRRVPHQFENAVHATGMILLLLLMLYINVMDFVNPIVLPTP